MHPQSPGSLSYSQHSHEFLRHTSWFMDSAWRYRFVPPWIGEAVKCFECNSHNDTRCAEKDPPKDLLVDCKGKKQGSIESTFCRKIKQIIEFSVNNCKSDRDLSPTLWLITSCAFQCPQRPDISARADTKKANTRTRAISALVSEVVRRSAPATRTNATVPPQLKPHSVFC